jgi:hypothetical protein
MISDGENATCAPLILKTLSGYEYDYYTKKRPCMPEKSSRSQDFVLTFTGSSSGIWFDFVAIM